MRTPAHHRHKQKSSELIRDAIPPQSGTHLSLSYLITAHISAAYGARMFGDQHSCSLLLHIDVLPSTVNERLKRLDDHQQDGTEGNAGHYLVLSTSFRLRIRNK